MCDSEHPQTPIACLLAAMGPSDRAREQAFLAEHPHAFVEVREEREGFAYRYGADAALHVGGGARVKPFVASTFGSNDVVRER